jgi:hypothetical protein
MMASNDIAVPVALIVALGACHSPPPGEPPPKPVTSAAIASAPPPAASAPPASPPTVIPAGPAPCEVRESDAPNATSPDGKVAVFVHVDPVLQVETSVGATKLQHLCIQRPGEPARVLLAGKSVPGDGADGGVEQTLADFDNLVFSPDGNTLYFTSSAWVTSAAAHAVDVRTGKERFIVDGAIVRPLTSGPFKGNLLATHYRLDSAHPVGSPAYRGRMESWSVISPAGKTVKKLPEDDAARARALGENKGSATPH